MPDESSETLSADRPIETPDNDRLGYNDFARNLADGLMHMSPTDGYVAAVYAPWGAGKTSLLNLVEHYVRLQAGEVRPIVIHFNPWWFSGDESLVRHFFDQLLAGFESKTEKAASATRKSLTTFASAVSESPATKLLSHVVKLSGLPISLEEGAKVAAKLLKQETKDVTQLKKNVSDALRKHRRRILVIIDGIDRLTAEEIRSLFKVVKAVADFPYVVYLLAFDRAVVAGALASDSGRDGDVYLEKIVQLPFDLPMPDKVALGQMLTSRLDAIVTGTDGALFDSSHWTNLYMDGIIRWVATPRAVLRLTNILSVAYPAVIGEVNAADFIAITALQVFHPDVYTIVRANKDMFCGYNADSDHSGQSQKRFHDAWLASLDDDAKLNIITFVQHLFPKLHSTIKNANMPGFGAMRYGAESISAWRKARRICSTDAFDAYFRLAVPESSVSRTAMLNVLSSMADSATFESLLLQLSHGKRPDGTTKARIVLEQLEDYTATDIPVEAASQALLALANAAGELEQSEKDAKTGLFDIGISVRIGRVFYQLTMRLQGDGRLTALRAALGQGTSLGFVVQEIATMGQFLGKYGGRGQSVPDKLPVSIDQLAEFEQLGLERIREAASAGTLLTCGSVSQVLHMWADWGGHDEVAKWTEKVTAKPGGAACLLAECLQRVHSQSVSELVVRVHNRLDPEWLAPYMAKSLLHKRVVRDSRADNLSVSHRVAVEQYLMEWDRAAQGNPVSDLDPN